MASGGMRRPAIRSGSASSARPKSARSSRWLNTSWLCCEYMTSTGLRSMMIALARGSKVLISFAADDE
jgi:hypothetical protein